MTILRKLVFSVAMVFPVMVLADAALAVGPEPRVVRDREKEGLKLLEELEEPEGEEAKVAEPKEEDLLLKLGRNIQGALRLRGQQFIRHPDATGIPNMDRENTFGEARLDLSTWTGTKVWRIGAAGWVEGGNQIDTYDRVTHFLQDKGRERRYAELNEIFALVSVSDFDFTVGKTLLKNGIATIYSPADRYTPKDFNDPLDSKELGLWQLRMDYAWDNYTVTAALLPVYGRSKEPHERSRWLANSVAFDFPGQPFDPALISVKTDVPGLDADNISYFTRLNGTVSGWDFFLAPYYGTSAAFVQRQDQPTVIIKHVPKVTNLTAGFATVFKKWQFHGEGLYNYTHDGEDDDYVTGVLGFTYKLESFPERLPVDWIEFTLEYAGEKIVDEQDAEGFINSSRDARLGNNNLLFGAMVKINEDLSFQVNGANQFGRSDLVVHVEGKYRIVEDVHFTLGYDEFLGQDTDTFYGRWAKNDRLTAILEYVF